MKHLQHIHNEIEASIATKRSLLADEKLLEQIDRAASVITNAYRKGHKTLLAGNGGSAADAQHLAGEFVSRFYFDRPGISSIALTTDTSILTAVSNDYGFSKLFARQIQAQGCEGDVFIGISTSGNSPNIVEAFKECKNKGIFSIGFTGTSPCAMDSLCDICIKVPSSCTPRIQESHIMVGHIICSIVEEELFGENRN